MNRNCNSEQLVSFKPCRLVFAGTDVPKPPEQGVEGAAAETPKTPEEKRQQLADGIQKIEQKVAALTKQIDERSKDTTFQGVLSARKLDVGGALKDIAAKVAAIKANPDKPDTDKHAATLDEIQKVLAPLEDAVDSSDFLKKFDEGKKQAEREEQAKLKKFNDEMKAKFPKDEAERAKAFKEAKAEKGNDTAEVGKEFKLKESTNLFDNIGKKEGRIVGVLTEDTTVKIIDKKMMSVATRGDIADATGFDKESVHPWVKVEGKFKTGVDGKGPEKTYKGWIPWELIKPEAGKTEAKPEPKPEAKPEPKPEPKPEAKPEPKPSEIVKPKMYTNPDRPLITNLPEDGKWHPGSEVADSSDPNLKTHPKIQYMAENGELHARYSGDKYGQKGIDTTTVKWNKDGKKWDIEKTETDETKVNWPEAYIFIIDDIIKEADGKNIKPENFGNFVQTYLHQDFSKFYKTPIEKSGKTEDQFIKDAGAKFEAKEAAKPKFATVEGGTIKLPTPGVNINLTEGTRVQINEKDGEGGRFQRIITNKGDIAVIDSNTKETFIYDTDGKPPKWERIPAGDYKPNEEQQKAIQSATELSRQVLEPKGKPPTGSPDAISEVGAISDEVLKKMDPITTTSLGMQWVDENQAAAMLRILGPEYVKQVYVVKGAKFPGDALDAKAKVPGSPGYTTRELLMRRQQELLREV